MFSVSGVSGVLGVSGVSFRFLTTKPGGFGPNPNKPEKSVPTHLRHKMDAENSQKGNSLTGLQTRSCPASYRRSFFSAKPTFFPRSCFFFGRRGM